VISRSVIAAISQLLFYSQLNTRVSSSTSQARMQQLEAQLRQRDEEQKRLEAEILELRQSVRTVRVNLQDVSNGQEVPGPIETTAASPVSSLDPGQFPISPISPGAMDVF
jgi:septal ring factor EnvC (AmiA/AmiB activator)